MHSFAIRPPTILDPAEPGEHQRPVGPEVTSAVSRTTNSYPHWD
jgi:hypothetical protein